MEPLVSIIMSTLNTKKEFLNQSIESILKQTYKNFEFIIIVDGGNDEETISEFNDKRVKLVKHNFSQGLTKSLNEAIKISRGKYIARMDSDDISLRNRLKIQVEFMEKNPDIDISATYYKRIGEQRGNVKEIFNRPKQIRCKLFFTNVIAHPSVMFRKSFLVNNKVEYDEKYIYSQDFELWTRCSKIGQIQIIPRITLKYRIHKNQISTEKYDIQSKLYCSVLKRNLSELEIEEENLKYLLELNGRKKIDNKEKLKRFIREVNEKNKTKKIYDNKELKRILHLYYIIALLKNIK